MRKLKKPKPKRGTGKKETNKATTTTTGGRHGQASKGIFVVIILTIFLLGGDEYAIGNFQWKYYFQEFNNNTTTATTTTSSSNKNRATTSKSSSSGGSFVTNLLRRKIDDDDANYKNLDWSSWINTTGIKIYQIHGDKTNCKDVIYTCDTRVPSLLLSNNTNTKEEESEYAYIDHTWEALSFLIKNLPIFNSTCLAFFKISNPFIQENSKFFMHPVWGRLPATVLGFDTFPKAQYFLYMDTDALLALPNATPTTMYQELSYDGYSGPRNSTFQHQTPGLIVNKPLRGWLCEECQKFHLGHGCFNTGVLLWKKSTKAHIILKSWWESRLNNRTQNLFLLHGKPYVPASKTSNDPFFAKELQNRDAIQAMHGWTHEYDDQIDVEEKMSEQNRLMYLYNTLPEVRDSVWVVPRQWSYEFGGSSCPDTIDVGHTPCLQNDFAWEPKWNDTTPTCYVNHYTDEKQEIHKVKDMILGRIKTAKYGSSSSASNSGDGNGEGKGDTSDGGGGAGDGQLLQEKDGGNGGGSKEKLKENEEPSVAAESDWSSWIDANCISLHSVMGDRMKCTNVIYTGDTRSPFKTNTAENAFIHANWEGLSHVLGTSPALSSKTCLVYFRIADPFIAAGKELHSVWGRVPATALMFASFPSAQYFLYMDSDATLASPDHTPETMYKTLIGENPINKQKQPGLIVNKPFTGWLCSTCEKYGLGHGCINSGTLLWHRSAAAKFVLKTWWESRLYNQTQNFFHDGEPFHGWGSHDKDVNLWDKMGEQNRLMYIYGSNPKLRHAIWIVPRQISDEFKSESCPEAVDEGHVPCLQNDGERSPRWKTAGPSCFVNHYADNKNALVKTLDLIRGNSATGG